MDGRFARLLGDLDVEVEAVEFGEGRAGGSGEARVEAQPGAVTGREGNAGLVRPGAFGGLEAGRPWLA